MPVKASAYIKLGTALRYLIDVREGELIGGKHILANCRSVRQLIEDLGFEATRSQEAFGHFDHQYIHLSKLSDEGETKISEEDAGRLGRVSRRVRDALLSEATTIEVFPDAPSLPQKITLSYLWSHVDLKVWLTFLAILGAVFTLGVRLGSEPAVLSLLGSSSEQAEQQPAASPPGPGARDQDAEGVPP
jgi:hypothetical protein